MTSRYEERIWKRIADKTLRQEECDYWLGGYYGDRDSRPQIFYKGKKVSVTRLIMHLKEGFDLDSPLLVLHKLECKLRGKCIRYEHLYVGNYWDNMNDRIEEKTHCIHGHEYTKENTILSNSGKRCRECKRIANRKRTRKNK